MRLDPTKAFPHPVLRPAIREEDADYPGHGIQTILDVEVSHDDDQIEVSIEFMLQQSDILREIDNANAKYGFLVWCRSTLFRDLVVSSTSKFSETYKFGILDDVVEVRPLVVAIRDIKEFSSNTWNTEFGSRVFDIDAGNVLAQDEAQQFPATQAYLKPVTSVFDIVSDDNCPSGSYDVDFEQRIRILMSHSDRNTFLTARQSRENRGSILSGIYLPVVLMALDRLTKMDALERQDYEWARAFEFAMAREGIDIEDVTENNRSLLELAQKLLKYPLRSMPFMLGETV